MKRLLYCILLLFIAAMSCMKEPFQDIRTPHPDETIYITNQVRGWQDADSVSVNGSIVPVEVLDSVTARVSVPYSSVYSIIYPHCTGIRAGEQWQYDIPLVQEYSGTAPFTILYDAPSHSDYFPFTTAVLKDITPRIGLDIYAIGKIVAERFCLCSAEGPGHYLDCKNGLDVSTDWLAPTHLSFAVTPGTYAGLSVQILASDGHIYDIPIPNVLTVSEGQSASAGCYEVSSSTLTLMNLSPDPDVKGTIPWKIGTKVNVNGTVCHAIAASGGKLSVPVTKSDSYTVAWPPEAVISGSGVSFAGTSRIGVMPKAQDTAPRLVGTSATENVILKQTDGILRLKTYTDPSITRMIKSMRVEGRNIASGYLYSTSDGSITIQQDTAEGVDIIPEGGCIKEGTSLEDDYTSFCICLPPGKYEDLRLLITAYDASYKCPYELSTDDLLVTTEYPVGDASITAGAVTLINIAPKVVYYDWIRSNGTPFIGTMAYNQALQGVINTGWTMPSSRGVSVEYEATVSGSVFDIKAERCLFGAQGTNSNKPVTLVYDKTNKKGWYATMACMSGTDTFSKAEKNGKVFHIDRDLADKRVIQIGTEGIFNKSYFYFRYKNLDRGDTAWTELWEQSDYFKFTAGNLKCDFPVVLFANNKQGKITGAISDIRFHNFKITCGGKVERDMYPCTVDGIPGMHDKAYGKFYFNDTPGVLVVTKYGCYSPMEVGN